MLDEPKAIEKKFKRAVTDNDAEVRYDVEAKPGGHSTGLPREPDAFMAGLLEGQPACALTIRVVDAAEMQDLVYAVDLAIDGRPGRARPRGSCGRPGRA